MRYQIIHKIAIPRHYEHTDALRQCLEEKFPAFQAHSFTFGETDIATPTWKSTDHTGDDNGDLAAAVGGDIEKALMEFQRSA